MKKSDVLFHGTVVLVMAIVLGLFILVEKAHWPFHSFLVNYTLYNLIFTIIPIVIMIKTKTTIWQENRTIMNVMLRGMLAVVLPAMVGSFFIGLSFFIFIDMIFLSAIFITNYEVARQSHT